MIWWFCRIPYIGSDALCPLIVVLAKHLWAGTSHTRNVYFSCYFQTLALKITATAVNLISSDSLGYCHEKTCCFGCSGLDYGWKDRHLERVEDAKWNPFAFEPTNTTVSACVAVVLLATLVLLAWWILVRARWHQLAKSFFLVYIFSMLVVLWRTSVHAAKIFELCAHPNVSNYLPLPRTALPSILQSFSCPSHLPLPMSPYVF